MRFAVVLATLVGLAVATPKSPIFKRQCPIQPQDCCLKTGTCDTCYYGTEPYPCNCECLEVGGCPCTEIDNDYDPPRCIGYSAGESGHVSPLMCLTFLLLDKANYYYSAKCLKLCIDRRSVGEAIGLKVIVAYLSMI